MCGRFFVESSVFVSFPSFGIWVDGEFEPSPNIAPSQIIAVVSAKDSGLIAAPMKWGYTTGWDSGPKFIINLKSETILEKKFAASSLKARRCIIPASGFYEWKTIAPKKKVPYAFQLENRSPIGFAAIYFQKNDGMNECVLLTTAANSCVAEVHDRMPVVLTPQNWKNWISETDVSKLLQTQVPMSQSIVLESEVAADL